MRSELLKILTKPLIHHPNSWFRREVKCNTVFLSKAHFWVPPNVSHDHTNMLLLGHDVLLHKTQLCTSVDVFTLKVNDLMIFVALTRTSTQTNKQTELGSIVQGGQRYLPTLHWGGSHAMKSHFSFYHFIWDVQAKAILVTLQKKQRDPLITKIKQQRLLLNSTKIYSKNKKIKAHVQRQIRLFFFFFFFSSDWEASSRVVLCSWLLPTSSSLWKMASHWSTGRLPWQVQTTAWVRRSGSLAGCWHLAGWRRRGRGTLPCRSGSLGVLPALWIWAPWCQGWSPTTQGQSLVTLCVQKWRKWNGQILLFLPASWDCRVPQRWQTRLRCVLPAQLPSPAPSPPGRAPCRQTQWPAAGPCLWREVRGQRGTVIKWHSSSCRQFCLHEPNFPQLTVMSQSTLLHHRGNGRSSITGGQWN